jgi:hypothetical protein
MFHPAGHPMERGWVGRVDGERVVHLAAQTLQTFFTGGGSAREHAEYPRDAVVLLAPVLHPPAIRVFDEQDTFAFANPAAIVGQSSEIAHPSPCNDQLHGALRVRGRLAAVVGAESAIVGFTAFAEWRDPARSPPKDRDFALGLGPVVVTVDALDPSRLGATVRIDGESRLDARVGAFDWEAARALAADGTRLLAGDLLVGPALEAVDVPRGSVAELEVEGIGILDQRVAV